MTHQETTEVDRRTRLAVLCSGQGTNLQAILDAQHEGVITGDVAVVVCDRAKAPAIGRAERAGVPVEVIETTRGSRQVFESRLRSVLQQYEVQLICLAGFMRILSPEFVHDYEWQVLNIHPALLPAFPGAHAVADALKAGAKETGVTVHLVDSGIDTGPIVLQEAIEVLPEETKESLLERLHKIEHRLYPQAIQLWIDGGVQVDGHQVKVS